MANWRKRIELNSLFDDGIPDPRDDAEGFQNLKDRAVDVLNSSEVFPGNLVGKVRNARSLTGLENALSRVYDYADAHLIWLGL